MPRKRNQVVPDKPKEESKAEVRFRGTKFHLTYKGWIVHTEYLAWLGDKRKVSEYSIVHEEGSGEIQYKHTHVLISFNLALDTKSERYFDYDGVHPNIVKVKNDCHWNHVAQEYHVKEGTPRWTNIVSREPNAAKRIWGYSSLREALEKECGESIKNAGAVIATYNVKEPTRQPEPQITWRPWQAELLWELNNTDPNDRTTLWYDDESGNSGKTFFTKYMSSYGDALCSSKANSYHMSTCLFEAMKRRGGPYRIIVFNFTRQQENHLVYQTLEEIKDGLMTCEKYKGETMTFPSPHLVVFSNYGPKKTMMTHDRWDIRKLDSEGQNMIRRTVGGKVVPAIKPSTLTVEEIIREIIEKVMEQVKPK